MRRDRGKRIRILILPLLFILLTLTMPWGRTSGFTDNSADSSVIVDGDDTAAFMDNGGMRKLYIGDIITLEIAAPGFSEEEMRQIFHEFEILSIERRNTNDSGAYLISLRSFDVGECIIHIGDKEVVIQVASTLDDIRREDIYDGGTAIIHAGFRGLQLQIIICLVAGVFVLSGGFLLLKMRRNARNKPENAFQLFLRRAALLSTAEEGFLVELTFYFKEYLESLSNRPKRIIGKTSAEIILELASSSFSTDMLLDIKQWLTECDRLKFTGVEASREDKSRQYEWLMHIVGDIEAQRQSSTTEILEGNV